MDEDALVLVAGANGDTGREVVAELAERGVRVRGLTRRRDAVADLERLGASEVVVGDLLVRRDAERAVDGCDAVVCAVGTTIGLDLVAGDELVDNAGVMNLVDAARGLRSDPEGVDSLDADPVDRFVLLSAIGVGDSKDAMPLAFRAALNAVGVLDAKAHGEHYLRESGLPYTILRPGRLTGGPATSGPLSDTVVVGEGGSRKDGAGVSGSVPRADLARLLVASLFTQDARDRTLEVVARDGLRGEPSGTVEVDWELPGLKPSSN